MGQIKPATPMQTDNSTANGIVKNTVLKKGSKAVDMQFHWIQYQIKQDHLHVLCKLVTENLGDNFTKNHPPHDHREIRTIYLNTKATIYKSYVRVCSLLTATEKQFGSESTTICRNESWCWTD